MSESEAVCRAVARCWDDEVWLEELTGRFWRLTLQVRAARPAFPYRLSRLASMA